MSNTLDVAKTYQQMTPEKQAIVDYSINLAMGFPDTEKLDIQPVFNTMSDDEKLVLFYLTDQALQASVKHDFLRDGDYLEHYGVRGMRWGIRRATTRGGTPPSKRKAKVDEGVKKDEPNKDEPKKKSVKDLSDSELNERIRRLQAEKQYAQLTTPEKAKSVVKEVLANSAKSIAGQVLTQVGTAYISKAVGVNLNKALPEAYRVTGGKKK